MTTPEPKKMSIFVFVFVNINNIVNIQLLLFYIILAIIY